MIKWAQFLQCPPPKICDGQKIVQNFSQFLTTLDFDREYLHNESIYQQEAQPLLGDRATRKHAKDSCMPRIAEMDVEITT